MIRELRFVLALAGAHYLQMGDLPWLDRKLHQGNSGTGSLLVPRLLPILMFYMLRNLEVEE